jgi:hypothetical protein
MREFIAAVLLACAAPLWAAGGDFGTPRPQGWLFSLDDAAQADPPPGGSSDAARTEESGNTEEWEQPGHLGFAFWGTPFLRFTQDPTGVGAGFGFEFSHQLHDRFGTMFSMSIWTVSTSVEEDGDDETVDVTTFDLEFGWRLHALEWRTGRMYMDLRFVVSFADGPAPVRSTVDLGGDMRWGFEFGNETVRTFLEAGMGWRSAVNYGDAGWLETGNSNGSGSMVFDLLRVGMRLYF